MTSSFSCGANKKIMGILLETKGLSKSYGSAPAVKDLSISLQEGDICVLLGPNGAGKTTTLLMSCGLLAPTSGEARVMGQNAMRMTNETAACVGFVPDEPYFYDYLTITEHMDFLAGIYKIKNAADSIHGTLSYFGLESEKNKLIKSLSHGMKKRLAVCSVLFRDPKLIVIDEPLTGLDPENIILLRSALKQRAAAGAAMLISTHVLATAVSIATRIMIIKEGMLLLDTDVETFRSSFIAKDENLEDAFVRIVKQGAERKVKV